VNNGGVSTQLGHWLASGFHSYKVNNVEHRGIIVNHYSNESLAFLNQNGNVQICDRGMSMCSIETLLPNCANSETLSPRRFNQPTDMMKVLNHQKKTTEYLSLIKQMLIGFEWSDRTNDLIERRTLGPIIQRVTRVHGSPTFPEALNYSEVRDLSK